MIQEKTHQAPPPAAYSVYLDENPPNLPRELDGSLSNEAIEKLQEIVGKLSVVGHNRLLQDIKSCATVR